MTERIRELIRFADVHIIPDESEYGHTIIGMERFAELIVQECSAFANHFSDGQEKDQFGRKMFHYTADIGQVILEHFGVEE